MTNLNGHIGKVLAAALSLAVLGIASSITVYGNQREIQQTTETNGSTAAEALARAHANEIKIGKMEEWNRENREAHAAIMDALDEIKEDVKK